MAKHITLNIGGVHEHYNFPWQYAIKQQLFKQQSIDINWCDCPGGTGEMVEKLINGELDIAIALTEGIIKSISENKPIHIAQWYVTSPLIWGIHVKHHSNIKTIDQLQGKTFAISRYGSGSHLMTYVLAKQQCWHQKKDINFLIINSLNGAINAFNEDKIDGFLWEKYTTQPFVDQQLLRRIGECPTPWPAFVIAISDKTLNKNSQTIRKILETIQVTCQQTKLQTNITKDIANFYQLNVIMIEKWLSETTWSTNSIIAKRDLKKTVDYLDSLNLLANRLEPETLINALCSLVE